MTRVYADTAISPYDFGGFWGYRYKKALISRVVSKKNWHRGVGIVVEESLNIEVVVKIIARSNSYLALYCVIATAHSFGPVTVAMAAVVAVCPSFSSFE